MVTEATDVQERRSWYAHSGKSADRSDWQPLKEHLEAVAALAADKAKIFGAQDWARLVGLLHDLGKYTPDFQARLAGDPRRADHATAGAKVVIQHLIKLYGNKPEVRAVAKLLAFPIAGHHAGLANGIATGQERSTLKQRLDKEIPPLDAAWQKEISLPETIAFPNLKIHSNPHKYRNFNSLFLSRMLFSCLIDADRIDTENYTRRLDSQPALTNPSPSIRELQTQLDQHLRQLAARAQATEVNAIRQEILLHARKIAVEAKTSGLYSLTVPTGGGKTLTSLAFGLDHAAHHRLRRVIYVIPFTSIIEQTAEVFRNALGKLGNAVLEHHCAFDREKLPEEIKNQGQSRQAHYRDKLRLSMDSWDAPIVVSTAVQFFESLYSDHPSQCRKLHNIAGSVIVLDEAQTLPLKLLRPIMAAIDELALNYGCSIILCTATQPALKENDDFHNGFRDVREIAPNPSHLFSKLRRTTVTSLDEQTDDELVNRLSDNRQVLMIVNNRRHARELFNKISNLSGAFHLTTAMCAEHRSQKLKEIRKRLLEGQSCRLVATSLIEAGVDVDFPVVYRAEAGLDSIAQAAGRCNREGRRPIEASNVYVFQCTKWKSPPELAQLTAPMRTIMRVHQGDILEPEAIQKYFQHVYYNQQTDLDQRQILKSIRETEDCDFPFQEIARNFKMIESNMIPIIIPFDETARGSIQQLAHLPMNGSVGKLPQKLQRYTVQVPERAFTELIKTGSISAVAPEKCNHQFYELIADSLYCQKSGLNFSDLTAVSAESSVFA